MFIISKSNRLLTALVLQSLLLGINQIKAQYKDLTPRKSGMEKSAYVSDWSISVIGGGKAAEGVVIYESGIQVAMTLFHGNRLRLEGLVRNSSRDLDMKWGTYDLKANTDMETLMAGLSYEWFPFVGNRLKSKFMRSLKLKGGLYYVNNPDYVFDASLKDEVRWGDVVFTTEEVGSVKTTVTTQRIQPFLGFGYDTFYAAKKINLIIECGLGYHGKPEVTMEASNMLGPTASQAPILEDNLDGYRYMPFLQLGLQYNL